MAEMVISMAILLAVSTAMLTTFTVAQRTTARNAARGEAMGELRVVMQRLTKEARQTAVVRAGSGASALDMDTYVNGTPRRITYTASGTTLTRSVDGGAAITVLERLTGISLFSYEPSVADPTDIKISLEVVSKTFAVDDARTRLEAEVELRNRG